MKVRTKITIAMVGALGALAIGSLAWAAVPDGAGVIHGCYDKQSGQLRVTDTATNLPKGCSAKEAVLAWNQQGPQGPAGPAGPPGPAGTDSGAQVFVNRFGEGTGEASAANSVECTLGEVLLTASTVKTAGGVPAIGQLLPIGQNQALFALLGDTYGGDGKTTFALPDLRPITPSHMTYSICIYGIWPS